MRPSDRCGPKIHAFSFVSYVLYSIYFVKQFHSLNIYFMGSYYDAMHLMQLNHKFHFPPSMIAIIMIGVFHWRICKWYVSQPQVHSARKRIELELKISKFFGQWLVLLLPFSVFTIWFKYSKTEKVGDNLCVCVQV